MLHLRLGGRWSLAIKEEPSTDFIKTEPVTDDYDIETGSEILKTGIPPTKASEGKTKKLDRRGKSKDPNVRDTTALKVSKNVQPREKPPEQEVTVLQVRPQVEPQSDLFADIFQSEQDLAALDSIVKVARQKSPDEESLVGVMSDEDDSSSSGVSIIGPGVGDDEEGSVGIMSSSDESSRESEEAAGDQRKESVILGEEVNLLIYLTVLLRVSDRYSFFTDPDPAFEINTDPDPAFYKWIRIGTDPGLYFGPASNIILTTLLFDFEMFLCFYNTKLLCKFFSFNIMKKGKKEFCRVFITGTSFLKIVKFLTILNFCSKFGCL